MTKEHGVFMTQGEHNAYEEIMAAPGRWRVYSIEPGGLRSHTGRLHGEHTWRYASSGYTRDNA